MSRGGQITLAEGVLKILVFRPGGKKLQIFVRGGLK